MQGNANNESETAVFNPIRRTVRGGTFQSVCFSLCDIKLVAMITAFLGFWLSAFGLFLGVVLCSLYAVTLIARRRATATTRLPLGTFLCIGGLIAAILGAPVIAWYASLF